MLTGRIVLTPDADHPYKAVLEDGSGTVFEHPVSSMREGEALIRAHRPVTPVFETGAAGEGARLRLVARDGRAQRARLSR